jgi:hypothetical protein
VLSAICQAIDMVVHFTKLKRDAAHKSNAARLCNTKLCKRFYLNSHCSYRYRCAFAHSLDELQPRSHGLTEAGFNFYDGVHLPFDRRDIAMTLKWAKWDRDRGHSVPKWVYDMSWDMFVLPWLTRRGTSKWEGEEEKDEETTRVCEVKKEEGEEEEDDEQEAYWSDCQPKGLIRTLLGGGGLLEDEEEEDQLPKSEDEEPHLPRHQPLMRLPSKRPLSLLTAVGSASAEKKAKLSPKAAMPQSSNFRWKAPASSRVPMTDL